MRGAALLLLLAVLLASRSCGRVQALDASAGPYLASSDGLFYPALDGLLSDTQSVFLMPSVEALRALPGAIFTPTSGAFVASRTMALLGPSFLTVFAANTTPAWNGTAGALQRFDIRSTGDRKHEARCCTRAFARSERERELARGRVEGVNWGVLPWRRAHQTSQWPCLCPGRLAPQHRPVL